MTLGKSRTWVWTIGGGLLLLFIPAFILGLFHLGPITNPPPTSLFLSGCVLGYIVSRSRKPKA